VENPSSYLRFATASIPEPEFLAELVRRTGCGLLCDVNNIYVTSWNFAGNPVAYLEQIPVEAVAEIHLAGHTVNDADGQPILIDDHGAPVADAVWQLYTLALARFGPRPTLIEWDTRIPELAVLVAEARKAEQLLGDGLAPEARLALYRHHVLTTLTEVLQAAYPVVCRLVEARFFAYAADQFIRQHPPAGPCLFEYGEAFPHFLADFPPCRALPYLPDVARLEWALHSVWYAEDAAPLALECLQGFAPHELGRLTLAFTPTVAYVSSPWAIERIWQANQPDADADATVPIDTAAHLEIRRLDVDARFRALASDTFAFRAALAAGQPLEEAFAAALATAADFCLTTALQALFAERLVVHAAVSQTV
jgi:hypothetical protein